MSSDFNMGSRKDAKDAKKERQPDMVEMEMMPVLGGGPFVFLWIDERQFYLSRVLGSVVAGDRLCKGDFRTVMGLSPIWERENSQGWTGYPGFIEGGER